MYLEVIAVLYYDNHDGVWDHDNHDGVACGSEDITHNT